MKLISKYPFESLIFLVLLYYVGILFIFEPTSLGNKITFFFVSVLIYLLIAIIGFTFRSELNFFRKKFFSIFLTGLFQKSSLPVKVLLLIALGAVPLAICSILEFLLTFLFTNAGGITIGFPLPIYSFTAGFVLWVNLGINLVIYSFIVYFIGRVVTEDPNIQDF